MDFQVENASIKDLLSADRVYKIPRFQRDYSWEEDEQCETFLRDLLKQISCVNEEMRATDYFLGTMIFSGTRGDPIVDVVDGQQRLTTATILLAALRDAFKIQSERTSDKETAAKGKRLQERYIMRVDDDGGCHEVLKTSTSYPYFSRVIQDKENCVVTPAAESAEEEHVKDTYLWFGSQLEESSFTAWLEDVFDSSPANLSYVDALSALRDQLLKSSAIAIFVPDRAQANAMFENINSKGMPLTPVDLIKNAILASLAARGVDDEPAELWAQYKQSINMAGGSFSTFFVDFWKAVFPADKANAKNLYQKYEKRYLDAGRKQLEDLLIVLRDAVDIYSEILDPDENKYKKQQTKYEPECLKALNSFGAKQVLPTLLAFYLNEIGATTKAKKEFLYLITDVHFAAFGLNSGLRSNKFTGPFRRFIASCNEATGRAQLHKAMHELEHDLVSYLDRQIFIEKFMQLQYSKGKKVSEREKRATSYALRRIANKLDDGRDYSDNITSIEHIIDEATDFEGSLSIGNLTILKTSQNNELSSITDDVDPREHFQVKRSAYERSNVPMTMKLLEEYGPESQFCAEQIEERARWMAEFYWDTFIQPYTNSD